MISFFVIDLHFWDESTHKYHNSYYLQKSCAPPERHDLFYNSGCEEYEVPYRRVVCYCKENECNYMKCPGWEGGKNCPWHENATTYN